MDTQMVVDLQLQYPFNTSLEHLHELVRLFKLQIIIAGTKRRIAKIGFPPATFTGIFGNQKSGEINVPEGMRKFVARAWVK